MKKILNKAENAVKDMIDGLVLANPDTLKGITSDGIVMRKKINPDKVILISGGGSGHEPLHTGFVGYGMLDAAVCGEIFASPTSFQVYQAILEAQPHKGVLLIIKNYTGDLLNFRAASELAKSKHIEIDQVVVNDDVAIEDPKNRRGVAGTIFVHKIAGALAEQGEHLQNVREGAQNVIDNVRSIGFALSSCTVPAKGQPMFSLGEHEMEFGIGIHGEPGIQRMHVVSSDEISEMLLDRLLPLLPPKNNDEFVLLVNGMGGTPLQELFIFTRSIFTGLHQRNLPIYKAYVGNYVTSLDMAGASVSLLKVDHAMKELLEAPALTYAWKNGYELM